MILEQYIDYEGKLVVKYETANNTIIGLKITLEPLSNTLSIAEIDPILDENIGKLEPLNVTPNDYWEECRDVVIYLKQHPNTTLTQFGTYLSNLDWGTQGAIKMWLRNTAQALADIYNINIGNMTESNVFNKLKQWFNDTSNAKIKRLLFNSFNVQI